MRLIFLFIGGPEFFIVLLFVIIFFGADKLPEIARSLGKGIRQVKDATNDIKKEINESTQKQDSDMVSDINKEVNEVKENIDDLTEPVRRNK